MMTVDKLAIELNVEKDTIENTLLLMKLHSKKKKLEDAYRILTEKSSSKEKKTNRTARAWMLIKKWSRGTGRTISETKKYSWGFAMHMAMYYK